MALLYSYEYNRGFFLGGEVHSVAVTFFKRNSWQSSAHWPTLPMHIAHHQELAVRYMSFIFLKSLGGSSSTVG